jgi:hypothetical protein
MLCLVMLCPPAMTPCIGHWSHCMALPADCSSTGLAMHGCPQYVFSWRFCQQNQMPLHVLCCMAALLSQAVPKLHAQPSRQTCNAQKHASTLVYDVLTLTPNPNPAAVPCHVWLLCLQRILHVDYKVPPHIKLSPDCLNLMQRILVAGEWQHAVTHVLPLCHALALLQLF